MDKNMEVFLERKEQAKQRRKLRKYTAKTVVRKWKTKSGETRVKTYVYEGSRGKVILDAAGNVRKSGYNEAVEAIYARDDLSDIEKDMMKYYLDYYVKEGKKSGKAMRTTGFFGRMASNKVERMFANAGTDAESEAERLGVSVDALLDGDNWEGDVFTDPETGTAYLFTFSYWEDERWEII